MTFIIEILGKEVNVPSNNKKVIDIVSNRMKRTGEEFTVVNMRENYKKYYANVLQGICPTCFNRNIKKSDKFCSVCGLEIDQLEVLDNE